jgi:hypothetical protein
MGVARREIAMLPKKTAIIRSLNTADVRRQMRFDPTPSLIAQPK